MGRFQDGQHYDTLNGSEIVAGFQSFGGATEDGWFTTRDVANLPDLTVVVSATNYVFTAGDEGHIVEFTASSSVLGAIPNDATTNFTIGTTLRWRRIGTGRIFFGAGTGVTVRWPQDNTAANCTISRALNSSGTFAKRAANDWFAVGDLSAT